MMTEPERLTFQFAIEAVTRFALARIPDAPRRRIMRFSRQDGHPTLVPADTSSAEALIPTLNRIGLQSSPQYGTLLDCFEQFPSLKRRIQMPTEDPAASPNSTLVLAIRFIVAYVDRNDGAAIFDTSVFNTLFERLADEFNAEGWRWVRRTPLHNFIVPSDAPQFVQLRPETVIRPIVDAERDTWHNMMTSEQLQWPALANVTHLIEIIFERDRYVVTSLDPNVTEDDIVFVLRTAGSDNVTFGITEQRLDSIWNTSIHYANFRLQPASLEEKFLFDETLQQLFERRFSSFLVLNQERSFQFAKRRYNDGCSRAITEDQVVDFWIVAENLFSRKSDKNEGLRQRLSMRLATYISASLEEHARIFAEAYASYRDRSEIVHGALRRSIIREDVQLIQPHVKLALQRVMDEGHLPNLTLLDS